MDRYDRRRYYIACLFFEHDEIDTGEWKILFSTECYWWRIELLCSGADRFYTFCCTRSDLDGCFHLWGNESFSNSNIAFYSIQHIFHDSWATQWSFSQIQNQHKFLQFHQALHLFLELLLLLPTCCGILLCWAYLLGN